MSLTLDQFEAPMEEGETERLEFKEAKMKYDFEKLVQYCAALANEGGGRIVLGVTDKKPRRVVGTSAFDPVEKTIAGIVERLHLRVEAEVLHHPDGRVPVFNSLRDLWRHRSSIKGSI